MKRRFTILTAALALLAILAIPMGMRGQASVTWPGTTALPGTATAVANDQNVTIMVSSTNTYSNPIRIYANTTVTINVLNGAKILSVAYEASSTGNYVTYAQNATVTPSVTPTVSGKIVTWTYAESANVTEFTFKPSSQTRSSGISITYIKSSATTCATPTFSPAAGTYTEAQNVSINCATEGATIYYTTNGNDPTTNSTVYSGAINVSTNTTIKAMASAEGYDNSAVATAEYAFITLEHAGTLEDPYTVADARTAIDANAGTQGVYATGIVSAIPTAWSNDYNNITFNFVDNSGDTDFLQAYRCVSSTGVDASTVAVGDVVVVYGNLIKYGSTYEFGQGCELVSLTHPVITTPTVTVTPSTINAPFAGAEGNLALTYENIENFDSFDYYFCDADGNELEGDDPDWIYAEINEENDAYILSYIIDTNDGEARTAYMKVYTYDDNSEEVYAIVTVNQAAYEAPNVTWNLSIASYDEITDTDIVTWSSEYATMTNSSKSGGTSASNYLGGDSNNRTSSRFYSGNTLTISPAPGFAITSVVFTATSTNYANTLVNSTWTNATASADGTTVTVTPTDGATAMVATIGGTCGFTSVTVYYEENIAPQQYTLTIEGYGDDSNEGGYYLIASPVTVDLTNHEMTTGDFDLYSFDQAQDDEWRNYKAGAFTNLEPGKGYLYAHKTGGEFTLTGTAYDGDGKIELVYDDNAVDFKGWNLVGNPWGEKAYTDKDFYTMNNDGSGIDVTAQQAGTEVAAMTGIFVVAEGENETVTFSKTATGKSANLALNITNSSKLVDRAIVRFGEGRQLPKFQLNPNHTKVYFEQSNKDYAIVNAEEIGEMPVSFKAENNGTYTFSVNTENVEMEYLHLIDNMTGADIDLIANPSYSFEAKVTDYASRFRLVFSANSSINEQNANNFAFFNGNDWTINNEGEATLQVVDMTGRVLSTETVNGNATTKVNAATGVYMLRLINGNNIKTQKVVVK
ncbi:MAG: chitobiase/beta-hexosaminidase C-terminal domain-containing protein [Bacteroidales bacterium]|nr:chitobiase/beta-hexosaminidase C-terminal domain-containing protein [Bacteroidales bacterium]